MVLAFMPLRTLILNSLSQPSQAEGTVLPTVLRDTWMTETERKDGSETLPRQKKESASRAVLVRGWGVQRNNVSFPLKQSRRAAS